jgi:predicted ferric reductase
MPLRALIAAYAILALLPVAIGTLEGTSGGGLVRELAAATGLVALAMLLLQFVSSGRYEWLSGRAGIDHTMRFHQLAARVLTVLVLLHPLLLLAPADAAGWREMPGRAARLFSAPHLLSGVVAWVLLLVLVVLAVLRARLGLHYEWWRASHSLAGLLAALGGAHHALSTGFYSGAPWMARYWWALLALALALWGYLWLVKPFVLMRGAHRVVSNEEVGHGIREVLLEPVAGRPLGYDAGQFAWVLLGQPPLTVLDHPFSISSAPESAPQVRLLIKARGDFTGALGGLAPGARAYLDAPHGHFSLRGRSGTSLALIAGGIGIAPVIGLLRHLHARRDPRPVGALYGARNPRQLVHAGEIRRMSGTLDLQARFFVDEPGPGWDGGVGDLTREAVRGAVRGEPSSCLAFLCGPTPMMLACAEHLRACGVPRAQIVFERFEYD